MSPNIKNSIFIFVLFLSSCLTLGLKKKTMVATKDVCDSAQSGFGFAGFCLNTQDDAHFSQIPNTVLDIWNGAIKPVLAKTTSNPGFCIGDYSTNSLQTAPDLAKATCNRTPYSLNQNYGTFIINARANCAGQDRDINLCFTFDTCPTVTITMNGGAATCFATASGIGSVFSTVTSASNYIGFGFSLGRKYSKSVTVATQDSPDGITVTVKGHWYFNLNLNFPSGWLTVGGKDLSQYLVINGQMTQIIDFGNVDTVLSTLWNQIKNADQNSINNLLKTIASGGTEILLAGSADVTLKLDSMSYGFLADLKFEVDSGFVTTLGGGNSGLSKGFYARISTNLSQKVLDSLKEVYSHFTGVLQQIGVSTPSFPNVGDSNTILGVFIQSDYAGFSFKFLGQTVTCKFQFSAVKGSCNFSGNFFTAIADGAKWVIKKASAFFDETGKQILSFGKGAGVFTENAINASRQAFQDSIDNIAGTAQKGSQIVSRGVVGGYGITSDVYRTSVSTFRSKAMDVVSNVSDYLRDVGGYIEDGLERLKFW
jgi:hypothetical protein